MQTLDLASLERARARALGLQPYPKLRTGAEAERFLRKVGIALRYGATPGLPLASMYQAASGPDRDRDELQHAIEVTNHTMETSAAIEVNVIADRLCLVHREVMPAVYALVRRGRSPEDVDGLSLDARAALRVVRERKEISVGRLRKELGLAEAAKMDPAYEVLTELQRALLVDRGPFEARSTGVPYLSKDGYPYHLFHVVHADLASAARKLKPAPAAVAFIDAYLSGATWCHVRKMESMFKQFLVPEEIAAALATLEKKGVVVRHGKGRAEVALRA